MSFTFTQHPLLHLLNNHYGLFSGVQKVVAVFKKPESQELTSIIKTESKLDFLNISEFNKEINALRSNSTPFAWFDEESLPFRVRQAGVFQKEIFDEINKTILIVKIPSQTDGLNDLLFIYFDKSLNNYKLSLKESLNLNSENKAVIAKLLYSSINSIISDAKTNQNYLIEKHNPGTKNIIQSLNNERTRHQILQERFERTFTKLITGLYREFINNKESEIKISKAAIEKLIAFNGDNKELESVIKESAIYINTLNLTEDTFLIEVEDFHINTNIQSDFISAITNRYDKTIELLDKLNEATSIVNKRNLSPTGSNVGNAMSKKISAPAISDAIKNHRTKILSLFEQYPERWVELKRFFKPIQNIISHKEVYKSIG